MGDHKARVRKLVTGFNTLSDESKNTVLQQMEALKEGKCAFSKTQNENGAFEESAETETKGGRVF